MAWSRAFTPEREIQSARNELICWRRQKSRGLRGRYKIGGLLVLIDFIASWRLTPTKHGRGAFWQQPQYPTGLSGRFGECSGQALVRISRQVADAEATKGFTGAMEYADAFHFADIP